MNISHRNLGLDFCESCILYSIVKFFFQVSPAEDIYWEGENDLMNEFLEVDNADSGIGGHLQRMKRNAWSTFLIFNYFLR